jgi:tetratricopeptide (TPR) repeat protein
VYRELRAVASPESADEVVRAFGVGGQALAAGELDRARELLGWAKSQAPRSAAVREALGLAAYHAEDFETAHGELIAYRRLSGRVDQNHVIADCARALGDPQQAVEEVEAMLASGVEDSRVAEGLLVVAGQRAERGEHRAALATLERAELSPRRIDAHHLRLWYAAAELCEQLGDTEAARSYWQAILSVDGDFLDAEDRLGLLAEAETDDPPG